MVHIRALLSGHAAVMLARGATIATRFLAVRRQFSLTEDTQESQLLNYAAVQRRVLPRIAEAYALHFTGQYMLRLHRQYLQTGDLELLREVHATSSGLKSLGLVKCCQV